MPDKIYLSLMWRYKMGYWLNWNHTTKYAEKLQLLKLRDRNPFYTQLVDKLLVREYVAEKIGKEYLIPIFGVWDKFEDIDFEKLPQKFVIKCSHDSGSTIVCYDKSQLDLDKCRRKLNRALEKNYYYLYREWPYKNVKPKIVIEDLLDDGFSKSVKRDICDYKFFCFGGEPRLMYVTRDREKNTPMDFFDMDYNHLNASMGWNSSQEAPPRPKHFDTMRELAKKLSQNIPHVRIDFYNCNGKIFFGEMTFFHDAGYFEMKPESLDKLFVKWIEQNWNRVKQQKKQKRFIVMFKTLKRFICHPLFLFYKLAYKQHLNWMPDKIFLSLMWRYKMGYWLDWKNPQTFNEKLQWLKLNLRNPLYSKLVDKFEVRQYIVDTIGEEYLIPLLGVWDKPEEVAFEKLPEQFVLKCTHDSGGLVFCHKKGNLDYDVAKKKLAESLRMNYFYRWREWPYKDVKPRIIAEAFMEDSASGGLPDYKFFCFDGKVNCVMVCIDRHLHDTKYYFFDSDWKFLKPNEEVQHLPDDFTIPKPPRIKEMFELASRLSKGLPFARIDLYSVNGKIYFGEITFFPDSGYDTTFLREADLAWGRMLDLSTL